MGNSLLEMRRRPQSSSTPAPGGQFAAPRTALAVNKPAEAPQPKGTGKGVAGNETKKKPKVSGSTKVETGFENKKGEEPKNKFSVTAEVKAPVVAGRIGPLFLLKDLKLKSKGSASGPEPFSFGSVRLTQLQHEIALDILKLEIPKTALPKSLSFGAGIKGSGSLTNDLDTGDTTGAAGATASVEQAVKVDDLLPSSAGTLSLGAKLGGTAGAKQTFGGETPGSSFSAGASVGGSAEFKSPALRGPLATFGGLLGDEAQIGLGASADFSVGTDSKAGPSSKFGAGGKLSLGGKRAFVEITLKSEVELDPSGGFSAKSSKLVGGAGLGFKF